MYKLLSSSKESDDFSIAFDRSRDRRKRELTNNKNINGKYHLRIYLRNIFVFAEHQETATYGLGYKLTLIRNSDNAALSKANATTNAKIEINFLEWYVPHYTPSLGEYNKLLTRIKQKTPTNLHYPERSVFMKAINTQNFWTYKLGIQEGINVPIGVFVVFQQVDRKNDRNLNNDTFVRLPVMSAQVVIGTERYPDTGILLNYNDNDYSQGCGQKKKLLKL